MLTREVCRDSHTQDLPTYIWAEKPKSLFNQLMVYLEEERLRPNFLKLARNRHTSIGNVVAKPATKPPLLSSVSLQCWRNGLYEAKWHDGSADKGSWEETAVNWGKQRLSSKYRSGWRCNGEVSQGWALRSSFWRPVWRLHRANRTQIIRFPSSGLRMTLFSTILLIWPHECLLW